ncbi:MAG TPA: GGDEF domain-containing protein [Acidimicrobiales bacterium]|nr:GGDEF domain-containing protein [Acidimicrobiales bacterium]
MSPTRVEATGSSADPGSEIQRVFWLRHMRTGFGVFIGETVLVMLYLALTPHGPHRPVLWLIAGFWLAFGLLSLFVAPSLASRSWRIRFSATWTIVAALAVGGVASLDGGLVSPVLYLLFLPIAFAALAFTPFVAGLCGVATLASAGLVVVIDPHIEVAPDGVVVLFAVLAGASVLSVAASVNRTFREHHEQVLAAQVAVLAATDGLTGCAVHRVFHQRFEEEISRSMRHGHPLSLLIIDVDHFKAVNDTYGHLVGDHVLAAIGAVLRAHVRSFDLVGRLGGDEFAVLMPHTEPADAGALANRICREASSVLEVPVTLSIGVSGLDRGMATAEHMRDEADFALYEVKGAGRDGVAVRGSRPTVPKNHPTPEPAPTP